MLVDDGINGLLVLKRVGLSEFFTSYGNNCFYHSFWAALYVLYKICGTNTVLWYSFFSGMHALNTVLIFRFFSKLFTFWNVKGHARKLALGSSLLFLFSPFMTENIAWTATHHYALSLCYFLIISTGFIKILSGKGSRVTYVGILLLYLISLTTHEISFFFPLLWIVIYFSSKKIGSLKLSLPAFLKKDNSTTRACSFYYTCYDYIS